MSPVRDNVMEFGAGVKEEVVPPLLEGDVQGVVLRVDSEKYEVNNMNNFEVKYDINKTYITAGLKGCMNFLNRKHDRKV